MTRIPRCSMVGLVRVRLKAWSYGDVLVRRSHTGLSCKIPFSVLVTRAPLHYCLYSGTELKLGQWGLQPYAVWLLAAEVHILQDAARTASTHVARPSLCCVSRLSSLKPTRTNNQTNCTLDSRAREPRSTAVTSALVFAWQTWPVQMAYRAYRV